MPFVKDLSGLNLNAEYYSGTFQNVEGLILESWGPATRNPDYNAAMDVLLARLQTMDAPYISVNVISRDLLKAFPRFEDRAIKIGGLTKISLSDRPIEKLRIEIGREQANLKINSSTLGGNRTKRVLLHSSLLNRKDWDAVAEGTFDSDEFKKQLTIPTLNRAILESRVSAIFCKNLVKPPGNLRPGHAVIQAVSYMRDPAVKAWVLNNASGFCELCNDEAPFLKDDGVPYLEVHHVRPLAEGGSDTLSNTIALCPNCHMRLHYGVAKLKQRDNIVKKIERLIHEPDS